MLFIMLLDSTVSVSEVEALFELYKSISSSVIDDGLINKVFVSVTMNRTGLSLGCCVCFLYISIMKGI